MALLLGLILFLGAADAPVLINWDGPIHLLDDFVSEEACVGLHPVKQERDGRLSLVITQAPRQGYDWAVFDGEGELIERGSPLRGKNAVKEACKVVKDRLSKSNP